MCEQDEKSYAAAMAGASALLMPIRKSLNIAASSDAYVLADRGTWLSFKNRGDLAILVEGDKAVLLTADTNCLYLRPRRLCLPERAPDRSGSGLAPSVRMLLFSAGRQIRKEVVCLGSGGKDFPVAGIHNQDLGGLGAAINAE